MIDIGFLFAKALKIILNPPAIRNSNIDKTSKICSGSNVVNATVHKYSYVGNYCLITNAEIGSFCSIADYCYIGGAKHTIEWVSTSPVFSRGRNVLNKNFSMHSADMNRKVLIGNDVWIGAMCQIKEGLTIGDGAVIGMGSVVTKDVEPYSIVGGNPARIIRYRFSDEIIEKLIDTTWWDLDESKLYSISDLITDPQEFIKQNRGYDAIK